MLIHLPDGSIVTRYADETPLGGTSGMPLAYSSLKFFQWQKKTQQPGLDLALRLPPWLPRDHWRNGATADDRTGLDVGRTWVNVIFRPPSYRTAIRPLKHHLQNLPDNLKDYCRCPLLISAQVTSDRANALYGAAALDLPRRGVVHVGRTMGAPCRNIGTGSFSKMAAGSYTARKPPASAYEQGKPVAVENGNA
jgi:hypothetical protein